MNEQERINLESSIHDLQAGELGPGATSELLAGVAGDSEARSVLGEMVELQNLSRRSFGVDVDDEAMRDGAAGVFGVLRGLDVADTVRSPSASMLESRM